MKHRIVFLTALTVILLSSCINKYEDGPWANVWPVKAKVINEWKWAYAFENGVNRTGELTGYTIEFKDNDSVMTCDDEGICFGGRWNLISKKNKLQIIYGDSALAFDLTRVKVKELWLTLNDTASGNEFTWELVDADGKRAFWQ